jgi:hypothetical protein
MAWGPCGAVADACWCDASGAAAGPGCAAPGLLRAAAAPGA